MTRERGRPGFEGGFCLYHAYGIFSLLGGWGMERDDLPDRPPTDADVDQKISDWLVKITLLGEAETTIRSSIKLRFGVMDF